MAKQLSPKERILAERGIVQTRPAARRHKVIVPRVKPAYSDKPKTALMKYLEQKYHVPIEEVLVSGSLSVVAKKLGDEVDVTTLSRWIKRFKLRYTATNLPDCQGCKQYGTACEGGICYVLMDLGLYELVPIKKEEQDEGD
ncbi:hypothetical protein LCGC14_0393170 [marine sediment metagenome]|uniref:Uncharacterized protein n=1 Tax=marine sediment metagenome TaxID=412755 RepID=A0A0F9VL43_9ZZZZ